MRRAIVLSLFLSACRVACGPVPATPSASGRADRQAPPDVDRERDQAQWNQAFDGNSGAAKGRAIDVPAAAVVGVAAGGLITGAGIAVALHDAGAPPPSDERAPPK